MQGSLCYCIAVWAALAAETFGDELGNVAWVTGSEAVSLNIYFSAC